MIKKGGKMTIDKLAIMMNNSFESLEKKMATKKDLKRQEDVLQIMLKEIKAIHEDSKSFRDNISTLYTDHVAYDRRIENLTVRVEKIEFNSGKKF
ncbi:MAG: hypothetical protein PHT16_02985 [Candidatus Pacebacteria bacterium]|nr:hypothetical protein [Candidatus Paceibacterota bacterium]